LRYNKTNSDWWVNHHWNFFPSVRCSATFYEPQVQNFQWWPQRQSPFIYCVLSSVLWFHLMFQGTAEQGSSSDICCRHIDSCCRWYISGFPMKLACDLFRVHYWSVAYLQGYGVISPFQRNNTNICGFWHFQILEQCANLPPLLLNVQKCSALVRFIPDPLTRSGAPSEMWYRKNCWNVKKASVICGSCSQNLLCSLTLVCCFCICYQ